MDDAKMKITLTGFDKAIEFIGVLVLLFLWGLAIFSYIDLQEIIPIHYNAAGSVTKWGKKTTLLFFPITATVIFIGFTIINWYPEYINTVNRESVNAREQLKYSMRTLRVLKLSIALAFSMIVLFTHFVLSGQPSPMGPWLLPTVLSVILLPVGYYLVKLLKLR